MGRSRSFARSCSLVLFASCCRSRSFLVSKTFSFCFRRAPLSTTTTRERIKNELKSRVLLFFRA